MASAITTTNHDEIRQWVEARGGCPAHVKGSGNRREPGVLRIDYPGYSGGSSLEKISWNAFFDAFDANDLAFLYQDRKNSRFSKLVRRSNGGSGSRASASTTRGRKAKGSARASSREEKPVNALDLLEQQHRQVEGLFKELKKARTVPQKRRLCGELAKALAVHTKLEETIFYPAVFGDETEETLRESVEEHLVAKRILADLLKMAPSDPQFMGKVSVLEEVVRHHVEEEENELFPQVRKECGDDLEVLGASLQKRNRELMKDEPARNLPKETRSAVVQF
jgi:hemerythrin superfamily protein